MLDLLITNAVVLTLDPAGRYIANGAIGIRDCAIVEIGESVDLAGRPASHHVDAGEMAVLPGFISAHGHAGMSLLRNLAEAVPLQAWLSGTVWPLMRHAGAEEVYAGAALSCLEMTRAGITCFIDMWRDLAATEQAVAESGLRARLAFNMRDFGDATQTDAELREGMDALGRTPPSPRITYGLAPHSLYACSPELLHACGAAMRDCACHVQIHVAETAHEVAELRARHNRSPTELQETYGLLGENLLMAHGVWLGEADIARAGAAGASVSHNISSNLKLASGIAPLGSFCAHGVTTALGTDSAASNNALDPFREMRMATLAQRAAVEAPAAFSPEQALRAATNAGAVALGLEDQVGSIEIGKRADLVLLRLNAPHLAPRMARSADRLMELLVFAASGRDVDSVMVDGEWLMRGREMTRTDPGAIIAGARQAQKRLLARAGR